MIASFFWYAREDSNLWPLAPEAYCGGVLPCSTVSFPASVCGFFSRGHALHATQYPPVAPGSWTNRGHERRRRVNVTIASGDRSMVSGQGGSRRLGIGEFVDSGDIIPRLLGRLNYLDALAIEYPASRTGLIQNWA